MAVRRRASCKEMKETGDWEIDDILSPWDFKVEEYKF